MMSKEGQEGMEVSKIYEGSFTGDGTAYVDLETPEEPDIIYIQRANMNIDEVAARALYAGLLWKDTMYQMSYTASEEAIASSNGGFAYEIDGWTGSASCKAEYADGILNVYMSPSARVFATDVQYNWKAIKL